MTMIKEDITSTSKRASIRTSLNWHRMTCQVGGIALLLFAFSGLLHPIMSWTGPKAASFFPPQTKLDANQVKRIPFIMKHHDINDAIMVKVVPSKEGPLLQITEANDLPRRYFSFETGHELVNHDQAHAVWLARYYSGLDATSDGGEQAAIRNITFQTEFDDAYPWVNRLLPVYRITFDREDALTLFIYTELNALAQITDHRKTLMQSLFRTLHTWHWLEEFEHGRVVLMLILLLLLILLSSTGIALLLLLKKRNMTSNRNIHRSLGYLISLPILMFSISGTYHLLQYAYGDHHRGLKLGAPKLYDADQFSTDFEWLKPYQSQSLNGLSIIHGPNAERLYRLSFPNRLSNSAAGEKVKISHAERFKGVPAEQRALYINTLTGVASEYTDRDIAMHYAHEWSTIEAEHIESVELITRFGPAYDFRNKRLPVWRIAYTHHDESKQLFIDPVTGMLVDQTSKAERLEGLSFSFLHKWNFLTPIMGRQNRDIIISLILSIAILSTLLGYWLLLKRQKKRKRLFAPIPSLSQIK